MGTPERGAAAAVDLPRLQVRVVERFEALEPLREQWNALAQNAQTSTIFQTYEVHLSWWKAFGADSSARVLVAESEGQLLGVAPLTLSGSSLFGLPRRVVQFVGARSFDYTDFIVAADRPDVLRALIEAAVAQNDYDVLYLRDIPATSPTLPVLRSSAAAHGHGADIRTLYAAPTHLFNDPAADRQLAQKKSLKRHYNALKKRGRVEFRHCTSEAEIAPYLDVFFEQHIGRRGVTDSPSVFVDPRQRELFRELVRGLAPRSWLLFSVVLLDERPVAMHFGFHYGERLTWYKPAFDVEYSRESPGEVLIKSLIEYALDRKIGELDFTIGEEAFKYRFANHIRHNCAARVYRRGVDRRLDRLVLAARGMVERHPALERAVRKALWRLRDRAWV